MSKNNSLGVVPHPDSSRPMSEGLRGMLRLADALLVLYERQYPAGAPGSRCLTTGLALST